MVMITNYVIFVNEGDIIVTFIVTLPKKSINNLVVIFKIYT